VRSIAVLILAVRPLSTDRIYLIVDNIGRRYRLFSAMFSLFEPPQLGSMTRDASAIQSAFRSDRIIRSMENAQNQ
jgi:hypothetical protein